MPNDNHRYTAFISYRHEPVGRKWAMWLHRAIEGYRVPKSLVKQGKSARRVGRVFRDEEELAASADLSKEIDAALSQSAYLIVVCTPETPKSRWVNAEVERFAAMGRKDRILALLVSGEPHESFPPALLALGEPLAADVRDLNADGPRHTRGQAKLRLIATLLGLNFDDLRNREQRRQQARILTGAVVALAVAAGMGGLSLYAFGQKRLADTRLVEVQEEKAEAQRQRDEAEKQRKEAERRRAESEAVIDFINTDVFAGATPERMPNKAVRDEIVVKMLEPAAKAVRERFKDQPLVEAAVMTQIAYSFVKLGRFGEAEPLCREATGRFRKVLGEDHPNTIRAINNYAEVLQSLGRSAEAEPLFKDALERFRRVLGEDEPGTIRSLNNYALVLNSLGRAREAEPLHKDAVERSRRVLGEDHPDTIQAINNYAYVLDALGRSSDAEPLYKDAMERFRRVLGEDHPDAIASVNNYGEVLRSLGRSSDAEPLFKDALERFRRVLGEDHPDTILSINNYAFILNTLGRTAEAEPRFKDALERFRRVLGEDHSNTITSINNYADVLRSLGRWAEAEPLARQAVRLARKERRSLGPKHPNTRAFARNLTRILVANNKPDEARAVAAEFGLPDPTTQPAATRPTTQPLDEARVAEIRAFVAKLEADWAEADRLGGARAVEDSPAATQPATQPG